ncbi:MAG: hypothetical protein ACREYA_04530, partial [Cupriavidus necator]
MVIYPLNVVAFRRWLTGHKARHVPGRMPPLLETRQGGAFDERPVITPQAKYDPYGKSSGVLHMRGVEESLHDVRLLLPAMQMRAH